MHNTWYPLRFKPILKEKLWGGHQLRDLLHKTSKAAPYGESWEISDLPDDQSIVSNGVHIGKTLGELNNAFAKAVLGQKVAAHYGTKFPLLIKFIDAADDLSVQLHPNDAIAEKEHDSFGKTEMWYIVHAEPSAQIIVGFNKAMTAERFEKTITENTLTQDLQYIPVKAGDAFFIDAGLIHAIGKGVVLAEIQQTSDITYRVYDYERKQQDGTYRDLHIDQAKVAIDYSEDTSYILDYNREAVGAQPLKHSRYFKTDIVHLATAFYTVSRTDSFTIIIALNGTLTLIASGVPETLAKGETILIPAACEEVTITGSGSKFLEVYL
ncbi:mannose-6-phosphate isomerase [Dokdonia sinensis]|uniref:Phosphohexomutase n=1 Tax=Dokdonia sinensis TaxID=2479847 RepID=A0A3M0G1L9_9FLAO|nr:type I phosphomannose isomerase catalytic subunit [Dokdonia sinensis]RMB56082.1 mannose-6-phosphate isomerase [Dokdonia sinensis]